jgi:hypothetical protein
MQKRLNRNELKIGSIFFCLLLVFCFWVAFSPFEHLASAPDEPIDVQILRDRGEDPNALPNHPRVLQDTLKERGHEVSGKGDASGALHRRCAPLYTKYYYAERKLYDGMLCDYYCCR